MRPLFIYFAEFSAAWQQCMSDLVRSQLVEAEADCTIVFHLRKGGGGLVPRYNIVMIPHRRRISQKAMVVAGGWGMELNAALFI